MIGLKTELMCPVVSLSGLEVPASNSNLAVQDTLYRFATDVFRSGGRNVDKKVVAQRVHYRAF